MRALIIAACACALAGSAAAKETLVPAQYRTRTDGGGYRWDIDSSARFNISRMGQVNQLTVNSPVLQGYTLQPQASFIAKMASHTTCPSLPQPSATCRLPCKSSQETGV